MITSPAIRYHGAKFRLAPWLLSFFPKHTCYVEAFGGAAGVLLHRHSVEQQYYDIYNEIVTAWRRATRGEFNQRIFQNWAHLSAIWHLFEKRLGLPVAWVGFDQYCYGRAIEYSRFIRNADTLTDFWNTVAFLLDQQQIVAGWDFRITWAQEIKLRENESTYTKKFDAPRKLLLLRLNNVHKLYQQAKNKSGERNPMTLENLKFYFGSRPYYIGQVKQAKFKRFVVKTSEKQGEELPLGGTAPSSIHTGMQAEQQVTSAFVFDYEILGCELERSSGDEEIEL